MKILFVCMGNICRSPTAQGVFEKLAAEHGMLMDMTVDSAGTHAYHVGEPPDQRSQAAAARRNIDISRQQARQVNTEDFERFDLILAMDKQNLAALRRMSPSQPNNRLQRLMDFAPKGLPQDVPDPYYGGAQGFETVIDIVDAACKGLLDHIKAT